MVINTPSHIKELILKKLEAHKNKEDAFRDNNTFVRIEAYQKYGFTKDALADSDYRVRLSAYRELGFTKEALGDPESIVVVEAQKYFWKVQKVLQSVKVKYWFTKKEADLIKVNGLPVNDRAIIGIENDN